MVLSPAARCRTKHIEVHYYYVMDHVKRGRFVLKRVALKENVADNLTKPLPRSEHSKCAALMGLSVHASPDFDLRAVLAEYSP